MCAEASAFAMSFASRVSCVAVIFNVERIRDTFIVSVWHPFDFMGQFECNNLIVSYDKVGNSFGI